MIASHLAILIGALAAWTPQQPSAPAIAELSAAERQTIDSGSQVVRQDVVANSAWPRVTVYQFIEATPEEAAAVFTDYARHSTYFPGLTKSVVRSIAPRVAEVDYVLEVPVFRDEDYTVRDSLSTYNGRTSYRVDWRQVRARTAKGIMGSARFEPYRNARLGKDGTLIAYVSFVTPGQLLAGFFKSRALHQVRESVSALAKRVEEERAGDRGLLASQIAVLIAALGP